MGEFNNPVLQNIRQPHVSLNQVEAEAPLELEAAEAEDHLDLTEPVEQVQAQAEFNPFAEEDLDSDLEPAQDSAKPEMVNSPLGPRALRGSVASVQSAVAALTARDDEDDSDPFAEVQV